MYSLRLDSPEQIFTAKHGIKYLSGEWEELHEHVFRAVLRVSGPLNAVGYVADFQEILRVLMTILRSLDGKTLLAESELEQRKRDLTDFHGETVVILPIIHTTTELLAKYIADEFLLLSRSMFQPSSVSVEIEETPGSWGIYCSMRQETEGWRPENA